MFSRPFHLKKTGVFGINGVAPLEESIVEIKALWHQDDRLSVGTKDATGNDEISSYAVTTDALTTGKFNSAVYASSAQNSYFQVNVADSILTTAFWNGSWVVDAWILEPSSTNGTLLFSVQDSTGFMQFDDFNGIKGKITMSIGGLAKVNLYGGDYPASGFQHWRLIHNDDTNMFYWYTGGTLAHSWTWDTSINAFGGFTSYRVPVAQLTAALGDEYMIGVPTSSMEGMAGEEEINIPESPWSA